MYLMRLTCHRSWISVDGFSGQRVPFFAEKQGVLCFFDICIAVICADSVQVVYFLHSLYKKNIIMNICKVVKMGF